MIIFRIVLCVVQYYNISFYYARIINDFNMQYFILWEGVKSINWVTRTDQNNGFQNRSV